MRKHRAILPLALMTGGVLGAVLALSWAAEHLPHFQFLQRLEWMTYDWRVRRTPPGSAPLPARLGFVFIDDDSVRALGERRLLGEAYGLLWPRHIYGRLVRELGAQGARAVGMDVIFAERRPDHPEAVLGDGRRVASDEFFAQELERAGNVALAAEESVLPDPLFRHGANALGDVAHQSDADGVLRRVRATSVMVVWNPIFRHVAGGLSQFGWAGKKHFQCDAQTNAVRFLDPETGSVVRTVPVDPDGMFLLNELAGVTNRAVSRLLPAFERVRVWHMGIVLAAKELGLNLDQAVFEPGRITLRGSNGVERVLPVDRAGRLLVHWTLSSNDPRLSRRNIENVLGQDLLRELGQAEAVTNIFRDSLVVVGSAAVGSNLSDIGATPLASKTLLPSVHWNVAHSVLRGIFVRRAGLGMESGLILGIGLLSAWVTWMLRPVRASLAVALLVAGYTMAAAWIYEHQCYWLPVALPLGGALLGTHVCLLTYRAVFEQNERRRVRRVFARTVSPNVVQELLKAERLSLVGARRRITVLFADVRGFTEITEQHQARAEEHVRQRRLEAAAAERYHDEQAARWLATVNCYLGLIADLVKRHDGTLDKYIGDCVMAFWGAPAGLAGHASFAVRAALDIQRSVAALNEQRGAENQQRELENVARTARGEELLPLLDLLEVGTGLNTGIVTVGLMGSDEHIMNYTVFGREVNVASRLEGVSGHGRIIIGEGTYRELLREDPPLASRCRELPPVQVKGIRAPVKIYLVPWQHEALAVAPAPEELPPPPQLSAA